MKGLLSYLNKIAADELRPAKRPRRIYDLSHKGAQFMVHKHGGKIREYKVGKWVYEYPQEEK